MLPSNWMTKTWDLFQAGCERNLYLPKLMIFTVTIRAGSPEPNTPKSTFNGHLRRSYQKNVSRDPPSN